MKVRIELSSAVSPAVLMSAANVESSGLCAAAVTTGSMVMEWKLPIPFAGTMPQPDPKGADSAIGCGCIACGEWLAPTEPDGDKPAGMLPSPREGRTGPVIAAGLASGESLGLTIEPAGGSRRPTSPMIMELAL